MLRSPETLAALPFSPRRATRLAAALAGGLAVALAAPGAAAEADPTRSPTGIVIDSAALRLQPGVEAAGWVLTVSGPEGFYSRREIRGRTPRFELVGADGAPLVDGLYTWELRAVAAAAGGVPEAVAWGGFGVSGGVAALPEPAVERSNAAAGAPDAEGPVTRAPTHTGDVYIDGHLCVGSGFMVTECSGSEPLASRTILLRENNIRVRFEDTSDEVSTFPSTDWQLLANDSFNVGADYFAIQDLGDEGSTVTSPLRIDAGAGDNAIRVDGSGEVGLGTATPGARLHVMGDAIVEGDFTAGSSREIKRDFAPVEPRAILEALSGLPVQEWSYRAGPPGVRPGVRHLGPVAEDFHAAFGLGRDPRHVSPLDVSGVALAAIQGLHEILGERDAEIAELRRSRDELAERIEALERAAASAAR